jgi:hypothetical protein
LALIAALPGMLAAYWAYRVSLSVKTNNGKTIGEHVQAIESTVNGRTAIVQGAPPPVNPIVAP